MYFALYSKLYFISGVDCNDIKKTMIVFQLISIYCRLVPMVDMSGHMVTAGHMTPEQRKVCQQSAQFLPFAIQFMEKCVPL